MTRYLLDANAVITLLNDKTSNAGRRLRREKPDDVAIPAIVLHELFYGAFKSSRVAQNLALMMRSSLWCSSSTRRTPGKLAQSMRYSSRRERLSGLMMC